MSDEIDFYIEEDRVIIPKELKEGTAESEEKIDRIVRTLKAHTCHYCGFPIEKHSESCPDCARVVLRCAVCKLPISFDDAVGQCVLCEAKGHLVHMQEWVRVNGKCPRCLRELSLEGILPIGREGEKPKCPTCGKELQFLTKDQRWYCGKCRKYIQVEEGQ